MLLLIDNIINEVKLAKRHLDVLRLIMKHEPIGILRLSQITGIPDQQIRYSMRVLQDCGFLGPSTKGAVVTNNARKFMKNLKNEKKKIVKTIENLKLFFIFYQFNHPAVF